MKSTFERLKQVCGLVSNTRPKGSETLAVGKLKAAIYAWHTGKNNTTHILTTEPHGEQTLCEIDAAANPAEAEMVGNRLFELRDKSGGFLVLTGEELFSLHAQFQKWAANETSRKDFQ